MISMMLNLYNEKHAAGDEDGTGREDDQLAELEELCLLLVLHHTHYQDGHTWNTHKKITNSILGLIRGGLGWLFLKGDDPY